MAVGNLLQKCDQALAAYLISAGAGTALDVFPMKFSANKTLPCTLCESKTAHPAVNFTGVFNIDCSIYVRTTGSMEPEENDSGLPATNAADRVALTVDALNINTTSSGEQLAAAINAAAGSVANFKVQDAEIVEMRAGFEAKGDAWCDIIDLKVICSANDAAV